MKTVALSLALVAVPVATFAEPAMRFSGRVEPSRTVVIANHRNGVVEDLHFTGGEKVAAGDLLAVIDPREYEIALRIAQAALAEADAELRFAEDDASRQAELLARGTGSRVAALRADIARDTAAAQRDRRRAEVDAALLALERTSVNAPIGGTISPPFVIEGSFVEAKAGTVIATLDPVRVAYQVSYAERERALAAIGAATPPRCSQTST
ncbi:efflux RND transporter periplasmic adaptor subunit [Acuticoccus yangtzensis]|uniref:efflux RND transporter periplasmic adaptor subunit n=1 Tax=Acuticoccus yangtzensis TaxID=1443441 RepID=UPI000949A027|nr:efflux RND transporter periplasmic adaptor subunit [Acuticoccus yangtzensis]